jgi:hypothetical protein
LLDIAFDNGDIMFDSDFSTLSDSEALKQQLYVFLNIRACHRDSSGTIIFAGELEYDQNQGLDITYITDTNTTEDNIAEHVRKKLLDYYGDYISSINSITITKNRSARSITISINYITIFNNVEDNITIITE